MSKQVVGWDIGGAHLKATLLNEAGEATMFLQSPCTLWRGLSYLETAIQNTLSAFNIKSYEALHAITMTGELVDLFESRQQGVMQIAASSSHLLGTDTYFYATDGSFNALSEIPLNWQEVASANWHASASALARYVPDALLVDVGSTTTDVIAIQGGRVYCQALTDGARMRDGSLIYTGVVRTPLMALGHKLEFEGYETNIAAEVFATMADVYRLTGDLLPELDMAETADGQGKTALDSARRLARMVGYDVDDKPIAVWQSFAKTCKAVHMGQIEAAIRQHLTPKMMIVGAGAGMFLVEQISKKIGHAYNPIDTCLPGMHSNSIQQNDIAMCLPAYAVAHLLQARHADS